MASLQASAMFSKSIPSLHCRRQMIQGTASAPKVLVKPTSPLKLKSSSLVEELDVKSSRGSWNSDQGGDDLATFTLNGDNNSRQNTESPDPMATAKLCAIMEAVEDRVEMHRNIGDQRDNWNRLLLTSINAMTLSAATMAGIAAASASGSPVMALKLSSMVLSGAATGMLVCMNKIQPSQLAEEQRNAARLFKQLHREIQTTLSLRTPSARNINEAVEKVLALDKAYPLPLLGVMLEKFPSAVEPTVWWPQQRQEQGVDGEVEGNGWDKKLEEEMKEIVGVIRRKDTTEYLRLGTKALKLNKVLAISGPLLTGLGALGTAFTGSSHGSWAAVLGVIAGATAAAVNTIQHACQVGMLFEMYRSNAGFFKLVEETIESNINERDVDRRENGEIFEMKLALQLGRSPSDLRHLAASSTANRGATEEFASKLF